MDSTTLPPSSGSNGSSQDPSTSTPPTGVTASTTATVSNDPFTIPQVVLDKYPALVDLIKKTESMTNDEREYWFQILPIMTEEQVDRLKKILEEEATQLAKLDEQYQGQLSKLNQKHLDEWNDFQRKQDREAIQKVEAQNEAQERAKEDDILKQLDEDTP